MAIQRIKTNIEIKENIKNGREMIKTSHHTTIKIKGSLPINNFLICHNSISMANIRTITTLIRIQITVSNTISLTPRPTALATTLPTLTGATSTQKTS
jgi:hypothetical protein